FTPRTGENLVYELPPKQGHEEGRFFFKSLSESSIRNGDDDFLIHKAKEIEEQIRLFYVAVTRAEEALILTGYWQEDRGNSFLEFLTRGLGLHRHNATVVVDDTDISGLSLLTEDDVRMLYEHARKDDVIREERRRTEVIPLSLPRAASWRSVTEASDVRSRHGEEWLIIGDIMHRIFEYISKGLLHEQDIPSRAEKMFRAKGMSRNETADKIIIVSKDIETLKRKGVWQDIIMPKQGSFAELPFILDAGDNVYNGRIDRIIKENDTYKIYDYKTFPVKEKEVGYLLKEYSFQMNIYRQAVRKLFKTDAVTSYIVFTHTGDVVECK
ncbi:MAG: PD-(D/E)XK nuclease family protein, partial [Nitrospirota bacterium]